MLEQSLTPPEPTDKIPENIPKWLHWLDSCPSTNTWAIERASQLDRGSAVFTRNQTGGRGQYGRIWHSPPGVFTASFVLDIPHSNLLTGFSLAAGLAAIYALEDLVPECSGKLQLKWPNDISIDRQKLAGILCETASNNSGKTRVIVGIGINLCVDFAAAGLEARAIGNAVSLHSFANDVPDELTLVDRLRHYLLQAADMLSRTDRLADKSGLALLLPQLRRRDALLGCNVTIELASETLTGLAAGIDDFGRLLVRFPDGEVCALTSGRVRWN